MIGEVDITRGIAGEIVDCVGPGGERREDAIGAGRIGLAEDGALRGLGGGEEDVARGIARDGIDGAVIVVRRRKTAGVASEVVVDRAGNAVYDRQLVEVSSVEVGEVGKVEVGLRLIHVERNPEPGDITLCVGDDGRHLACAGLVLDNAGISAGPKYIEVAARVRHDRAGGQGTVQGELAGRHKRGHLCLQRSSAERRQQRENRQDRRQAGGQGWSAVRKGAFVSESCDVPEARRNVHCDTSSNPPRTWGSRPRPCPLPIYFSGQSLVDVPPCVRSGTR